MDALTLYEADMRFRNLQISTIDIRHRYLLKFSREIGFATATEQNIVTWLSRPISPKTRSMWISTLHSFFSWALRGNSGKPIYLPDEDGVPHVPTTNIAKPKSHPRHPRPMPIDDIRKALANASPKIRCWIACGAYEGMRCQEIAFLAREDINETTETLEVTHGKGEKQRYVPLHPEVLKALKDLPMPDEGRFWKDETAASISRKGNRYLHSLGVRATMHQLRHFFGTMIYQNSGGDIILTQGLLGHSSPNTTATYAAADTSKASGVVSSLTI
jgi:integrase